ncbi:hypothetical protein [Aquimarina litoralis]|uniref:hypothetical protein n=1 Tax=Aquimarina litoralis TaxID=584605 RepID=UPI001C5942FE|nr:hypothetical protein [Aquimarina litoralis]MBW1293986.1 hypothetical protein [Aquimarina litoralis]
MKLRVFVILGVLVFFVALIIFLLQSFTFYNITTAKLFKSSEFEEYPFMEEGTSSKNYIMKRMSFSNNRLPTIVYNTEKNFFLVYNYHDKVLKINAEGEEIFSTPLLPGMEFPEYSSFLFTQNEVYDFTQDIVEPEYFKEVINKNQELSLDKWQQVYTKLYKDSSEVLYGESLPHPQSGFLIYCKINGSWIKLYSPKNKKHYIRGGHVHKDRDILPAKFTPLVLLKDIKNNKYSNDWSIDDFDEGRKNLSYYNQKYREKDNISVMSYWKTGQLETAPFGFDAIEYYNLTIDGETLKFKESAIKGILGNWIRYIDQYALPIDYEKKSNVLFLRYSYLSNMNFDRSKGVYIIKKKKN